MRYSSQYLDDVNYAKTGGSEISLVYFLSLTVPEMLSKFALNMTVDLYIQLIYLSECPGSEA
jgi:hypothetical protein